MTSAFALALTLVAAQDLGPETSAPRPTPARRVSAAAEGPPSRTWVGVGLDGGVPNAAGASLLFRAWPWLRLHAGLAYDVIGHGYRGGVTLVPGQWAVTPTLDISAGRFTRGDATRFARGAGPGERALLSQLTYDYASAQAGLEFGSQRRFAVFLRGGLSYLDLRVPGDRVSAFLAERAHGSGTAVRTGDVRLRALVPSVSAGFYLFLF